MPGLFFKYTTRKGEPKQEAIHPYRFEEQLTDLRWQEEKRQIFDLVVPQQLVPVLNSLQTFRDELTGPEPELDDLIPY